MLRQKELFHVSEKIKKIKYNNLVLGGLYIVLVRDPAQLSPVKEVFLWVVGLPSSVEDCILS